MDVIVDELRKSGVDIDKTTLSYFINRAYNDYQTVYEKFLDTVSYEDLFVVWNQLQPRSFGHVMVFLTVVHLQNFTDQQKRDVVQLTIPVLKNIDISKYKRERSVLDNYTVARNIIHRFLHRYVCRRLDPVFCQCYVIANVIGGLARQWRVWEITRGVVRYLYYKIRIRYLFYKILNLTGFEV